MMYYDDDRQPVTRFEREPELESLWEALFTSLCMLSLLMSLSAGLWIISTL